MMCLKDLLLYTLLLPVPAASPIFIVLYFLALVVTIRPCGYCIALFATLFLTSSPSSPFVDRPHPILPINASRPLTSPVEERNWLSANVGRWMDPGLIGYRYIAGIGQEEYETMQDLRGRSANVSAGVVWPVAPRMEADVTITAPDAEAEQDVSMSEGEEVAEASSSAQQIKRGTDEVARAEYEWPWVFLFRNFDGVVRMFGLPEVFNGVLYNRHSQVHKDEVEDGEKTVIIRSVTMRYKTANRPTGTYAILTPSAISDPSSSSAPASPTDAPSPIPVPKAYPKAKAPSQSDIPAYIQTTDPSSLPPDYIDLRWRGIGFVLDLGYKRSEEGMAWEMAQMLDASNKRTELRRAEVEEREEVLRVKKEAQDREQERRDRVAREERRKREEEERKERGRHWIGGMPVVGSW